MHARRAQTNTFTVSHLTQIIRTGAAERLGGFPNVQVPSLSCCFALPRITPPTMQELERRCCIAGADAAAVRSSCPVQQPEVVRGEAAPEEEQGQEERRPPPAAAAE